MDVLEQYAAATPEYMRPNTIPFAAVLEGYLSKLDCDRIIEDCMQVGEYKAKECGAITRECGQTKSLEPVKAIALQMNQLFWQYDLDDTTMSWLQTYSEGGNYQKHSDVTPGRMRKLTAVALLTDPKDYRGGRLLIDFHPARFEVPKTLGTIVVFQSILLHEVLPVVAGIRQTINMAFHGPNFK
jgi:predicted 2-oxoglutarate/Fe(II)-dependent dioxygenase YbiX